MRKFTISAFLVLTNIWIMAFEVDVVSSFSLSERYGYDNYTLGIEGNTLFSVSTRGLQVFDISGNQLICLNEINLEGQTRSLSLSNNYVYVSAVPPVNRLYQIDVSNISNINISDTLSYSGVHIQFIDGNHLFVHGWSGETDSWIINVYDANSLQLITQFPVPYNVNIMRKAADGMGIVKIGDMAHLYDISDPNNIQLISEHVIGETYFPNYCQLIQNSILVYGDGLGLRFYDINNNWQLINSLNYSVEFFSIENNNLVVYHDHKIQLYDIADLASISLVDSILFSYFDSVQCLTLNDNKIYYTSHLGSLEMYEIIGSQLIQQDSYRNYGALTSAYLDNDKVVISTTLNGLTTWDIEDFSNPALIESYFIDYFPGENLNGENEIFNYKCYDIEEMLIRYKVLELDESGNITELAELTTFDSGGALYYKEGVGFFKVHNQILYKYELNNNTLDEVATLSLPTAEWGEIYFHSDIAYILSAFKVSVINNISSNENIEVYDQFDLDIFGPSTLDFFENYMIISEQADSKDCFFFDISVPLNPILISTIENSGLIAIDQENELMFMGSSSFTIYDISTIETGIIPELDTIYNWFYCEQLIPFTRNGLNYLLFLDGTACEIYQYEYEPNGINDEIISISPYLSNHPNPFNPSTEISFQISDYSEIESAEIVIYNIKGQKVRVFTFPNGSLGTSDQLSSGQHSITWDGTDQNNQVVSSGVYFYQLEVDGKAVATKKCLLLK